MHQVLLLPGNVSRQGDQRKTGILPEMTEQEIIQNAREKADDVPFDHTVVSILRMLLSDHDPSEFVRQNHLTSSLAADLINDALMDILGDTAVSCDDDRLMIVEDYREDLMSILGGT